MLNQALVINRETYDRIGEGKTLHNIGYVYTNNGNYDQALSSFQQALSRPQKES
jgi:tetratricopeptide (TPR) repeat protein